MIPKASMDAKKYDIQKIFLALSFIIFTIPRSLEAIVPKVYNIINILKIIIFLGILFIGIKEKIKLSKFTKTVIIYSIYLFCVTLINRVHPMVFLKVYLLNVGILLFCEIAFREKYRYKFIKFFSNYFLILLILNFIGIIVGFLMKNPSAYLIPKAETYFLGQDNRFILYIIPTLLGYYILHQKGYSKNSFKLLIITYIIGLISLVSLWSVAAFCVLILLGICFLISKCIKKKINIYVFTFLILLIGIGIVFFKVQNLFEFFIVDVLHKSLDLSYRTILWDGAIDMLKNSPINLIFGFGYFDTKNTFANMPVKVGHLHNIILNNLFFAGIIGSAIYFYGLNLIEKNIYKIKNTQSSNILASIFLAIIVLMMFDTFELYQMYYFTLFLLFKAKDFLTDDKIDKKNVKDLEKMEDKVGIMLATYNGEKYISEQIDSIIRQTYQNWIIFISDDGSTDNTMKIVNEYKKKYPDKIVILTNENKFSNAKLNFANLFENVNNMDYYMFCDQDDVFEENKIMDLLKVVKNEEKQNKIPILAYCDSKIVDSNLNTISESLVEYGNKHLPDMNLMKHVLVENYFPGCAVLFNKELKEKTGTIYKECEMHDWWLTLTSALSGKIIFVNEKLHLYRQHGNNTVGAHKDDTAIKKLIIRIKKMFDLKNTKQTWKNYQNTVLNQAKELYRIYKDDESINKDNLEDVKRFIEIMEYKGKLKKLILLKRNNYIPVEKIRILRLVL